MVHSGRDLATWLESLCAVQASSLEIILFAIQHQVIAASFSHCENAAHLLPVIRVSSMYFGASWQILA